MKPKVVYFGTPALAVPPLQSLVDSKEYDILAVVTQPDKPAGRGKALSASPVKEYALQTGIPVFQPTSLKQISGSRPLIASEKNTEFVSFLNAQAEVDAFLVVAYGKIIPKSLIEFPRAGVVNIHMSLLPRWRGAAPIQRAVLHGDTLSGVSIMKIDEGLDTGPVYVSESVPIGATDDSGTLSEKLVLVGSRLLLETLPGILTSSIEPRPQGAENVSYAEKLTKDDFKIHWDRTASEIICCIRAARPHPGAFAELDGAAVKVFAAAARKNENYPAAKAGTVVEVTKSTLVVALGSGEYLSLEEMQFPGKKRLPIQEILKGKSFAVGAEFH